MFPFFMQLLHQGGARILAQFLRQLSIGFSEAGQGVVELSLLFKGLLPLCIQILS